MSKRIADHEQRRDALDTSRSFIVQAPAGSGKTTLLIQRYLKLLAIAQQPEEIIAITFTRKAAAEMRNRIMDAFKLATGEMPEQDHEQQLWKIAREASKRDEQEGWQLRNNPGRLRIQTIDSLTSQLVRMMPMLSQSGGALSPTDRAMPLYREAARNTLLEIESRNEWSETVAELLIHLDNNFNKVEELLAGMLGKRDQWLRLIAAGTDQQQRQLLESTLEKLVLDALEQLVKADTNNIIPQLVEQAHFSAQQLQANNKPQQDWSCYLEQTDTPLPVAHEISRWQALAELVLVKSGDTLRKQATITIGFPPDYKEEKKTFMALLDQIRQQPELLHAITQLRKLPAASYSDDDWHLLSALAELLKIATAHLKVIFGERGEVDHIEVALRAHDALGNSDDPTDLALMLDQRIQHLLVDEFQDTSHGQYQLLEKLTAGWQPDDGRTLFCVGDPMQSIYRFREADVGLYLDACVNGIGDIQLQQLSLKVNFRSHHNIVEWVNQAFPACFPAQPDSNLGAVPYSSSVSFVEEGLAGEVSVHPASSASKQEEAQKVVDIIKSTPDELKIAILVRSRSHLEAIIPALRAASIDFRVTETERLNTLPVIGDLCSLVRALHHFGDRVAWMSLLRSPWCGLLLSDLYQLANTIESGPLWPCLESIDTSLLSDDGTQRLTRFNAIISASLQHAGRLTLRESTEAVWLALGGRDSLQSGRDLLAVEVFFSTLESLESAGRIEDPQQFDEALNELYAPADPDAGDHVEILTMHKSKGLEYDCIILPGLGRGPRHASKELLQYLQTRDEHGVESLLMTNIEATGDATSPTSSYIRSINAQRDAFEQQRLLYVATTRAKRRLHLLGHATINTKTGIPNPTRGSLLASLWPAVKQHFGELTADDDDNSIDAWQTPDIKRLPADWKARLPDAISQLPSPASTTLIAQMPEFTWAGELARHVGTVVHGMLEVIANEGVEQWNKERIKASDSLITNWLLSLGCVPHDTAPAVKRVQKALLNTLDDQRGQWILQDHTDAACEFGISVRHENGIRHLIIDRLFTDENGERWIIDYKSGSHHEADTVDAFLESEIERYRDQLYGYWHALKKLDGMPSRLALYFPMLNAWREIPAPE
ncbi:ATP-dependent exoDNAse (exonuclease V), beta subunit [Solemya velum gill symbiont]|uniref:DNA 3'-5' helicase n=1 Tax=Solemya velum gill symbiont TaxID=2340 RepID=A0A0B0H8V3_SOVGS|nr:UvrD-helicase domain-containing protein [Solemya velum gill symbiont]KHF25525.1 ATP-dependent exoDNAse (exonuclease V), beta subunit [Solemya velum gill symbiont]